MNFETPEELEKKWDDLDYSKRSGLPHWVEWAIAVTLLTIDSDDINELNDIIPWIGTSDIDYPGLPSLRDRNEKYIKTYIITFYKARELAGKLEINETSISKCIQSEGRRVCISKIADRIEALLKKYSYDNTFAKYAGDIFIRIAIPDAFIFGT